MVQAENTKIFLVGFMGTGKTTLGRVLADRLGWPFQDIDALMEAEEGASIVRIFADKGEAYFRGLERHILGQVAIRAGNAVVDSGGGAYCSPENQRLMDGEGITVWLDQPFEQIWRRRESLARGRPLMGTEEEVRRLYEQRLPAYCQARAHLSVAQDDLPAAIAEMLRLLHDRFAIG